MHGNESHMCSSQISHNERIEIESYLKIWYLIRKVAKAIGRALNISGDQRCGESYRAEVTRMDKTIKKHNNTKAMSNSFLAFVRYSEEEYNRCGKSPDVLLHPSNVINCLKGPTYKILYTCMNNGKVAVHPNETTTKEK